MKNVLIAGSTGTQGGAVADELLSGDYGTYELYGLTRDVDSEAATALADRGVTMVEGDMGDSERMHELVEGMDVVFAVTTFLERGTEAETEEGIVLADAAAAAGVEHFVFSSVGSADEDTGLPHFESKGAIEAHLAELDLQTTIVRPVFFMQNFAYMMADSIEDGQLPMPLAEGVSLDVVDAGDIGVAVASAIADPERFVGETITLAGDELTLEEFAAAFSTAMDAEITPVRLDVADYRAQAGDEMADMFAWFNAVGYDADPVSIHEDYGIETRDFATYLADSEVFRPAPVA